MGHRIDYPDDDVGRGLIESADGDYVRTTTNGYDAESHLTLVDSPEGRIHYAFNDLGEQTDTWTESGTGVPAGQPETARTWTHYDYDQIGRLLDVIAHRLNGQSVNLETDYAYLATGQLAHQTTPNGVTSDWSFDQLGRLVQLAHKNSTETLATFRYTRDAVGQIKHTDESGSAVFGGSRSVDYQYDAINRLTEEVRHEGDNSTTTTDYFFDLVGNRLRQVINGATTTYAYNGRDELLAETANGTTHKQYYDANGSLTQRRNGATLEAEYQYDLRNKMIRAAVNGVTVNYVYDQDGLQVRRTIGSDTDVYLQDKQNPTGYSQVLEHWRNGALYRTFVIGRSILAQVSGPTLITAGQTVAQAMQYLLADGHTDTRAILDATGQPITGQLIAYDTFGKVTSGQNSILTPIQYAGQWIDSVTGLSFNRARWYDLAGRFTQTDPRDNPVGDTINANGRAYAGANPVMYADRLGLAVEYDSGKGLKVHALFYAYVISRGGLADSPIYKAVESLANGDVFSAAIAMLRPDAVFRDNELRGFYELKPISHSQGKRNWLAKADELQMLAYDLAFGAYGSGIGRGDSSLLLAGSPPMTPFPGGVIEHDGVKYAVTYYASNRITCVGADGRGLIYYALTPIPDVPRNYRHIPDRVPVPVPAPVRDFVWVPNTREFAPLIIGGAAVVGVAAIGAAAYAGILELGGLVTLKAYSPMSL